MIGRRLYLPSCYGNLVPFEEPLFESERFACETVRGSLCTKRVKPSYVGAACVTAWTALFVTKGSSSFHPMLHQISTTIVAAFRSYPTP